MALHVQDGTAYPWPSLAPDSWTTRAACIDRWDEFDSGFGPGPRAGRQLRSICEGCPVRRDCLVFGIDVPYGIFGGLSGHERSRLPAEVAEELRAERDAT